MTRRDDLWQALEAVCWRNQVRRQKALLAGLHGLQCIKARPECTPSSATGAPAVVRDIRGNAAALSKYVEAFDQSLADCTHQALNTGQMQAFVKTSALYGVEAPLTAAMTGFIEEFEPRDAALLFQVSTALAFERNNSKAALLFSSRKRSELAEHRSIVAAAEAAANPLVHGPALNRFMGRFNQVAARGK